MVWESRKYIEVDEEQKSDKWGRVCDVRESIEIDTVQ
jgi:hypothetical protein